MTSQRTLTLTAIPFLLVLFVLTRPSVSPADSTTHSVSVYNSWEEEDGTSNSSTAQYLDLSTGGTVGGFRLDLEGAGRVASIDREVEPGDEELNRLYSLALIVSKPGSAGWLVLGRQPVNSLTSPNIIDGISISAGNAPFTVNARWGYIADISDDDPDEEETFGLGVDYLLRRGMTLALDYSQITEDSNLMEELLAVDWTYSWFRHTKAYITLNYDLMSETFHEILFGTRLFHSELVSSTFEYAQNVSQFEADSIYSVFAIDAVETTALSFLFTPSRTTRYTWEYVTESYEGGGSGKRYAMEGRWTPGRSSLSAGLTQHTGTGGDLVEVSLGVSAYVHPLIRLGAGGDISTTEPENDEDVLSYLGYIGGEWSPSPATELSLRIEQSDDEVLEEPTTAVRLALSVEF